MAKYYGAIGFADTVETAPGVWDEIIEEFPYYGDVLSFNRNLEKADQLNDNLNINNTISIVADAYALNNIFAMRYVSWAGARWKISKVSVEHPRLVLTIGGVYYGPQASASNNA